MFCSSYRSNGTKDDVLTKTILFLIQSLTKWCTFSVKCIVKTERKFTLKYKCNYNLYDLLNNKHVILNDYACKFA